MRAHVAGIASGMMIALMSGTAQAVPIKVTFQGTVSLINRQDGTTFGKVNVGDSYTATTLFNFDGDKPFDAYGLVETSSYNAEYYSITINGKTQKSVLPPNPMEVFYDQFSQHGESGVSADVFISPNTGIYQSIQSKTLSISGDGFQNKIYKSGSDDELTGFYTDFFNVFQLKPTEFTTSIAFETSTVPLPASAPMFGAALLALGAVGYGVKRKKAAAAA